MVRVISCSSEESAPGVFVIADLRVEFADPFIERHDALVSRGFRRVSVSTHYARDPAQHRAVVLEPLVFCGAECVFDFHGGSEEDEQVGDGKRVKLFNRDSEAAQQLPLPYLLRSPRVAIIWIKRKGRMRLCPLR